MQTERTARRKANVRAEILEAARAILARDGYQGFSMRTLAERVGYTPAATYKHFKGKDEIFEVLSKESLTALFHASSSVEDMEAEDPVDRLKRGMLAYVQFGLENPDYYRIAFLLHQPDRPTPPASGAFTNLAGRVQKCISAGRFKSGDAEMMAQSIWAAVHGITSLLLQKPEFPWVSRTILIEQVIDSAVEGLRARGEEGRPDGNKRSRKGVQHVRSKGF